MGKGILGKDVIALSGDFGEDRTHQAIKRWIEANGGKFEAGVSSRTTHLVCSRDHWKKCSTMVKVAQQRGNIKIVSYDWLEDSLQAKSHRREGKYLWEKLEKATKLKKEATKAATTKIVRKEVKKFKKENAEAKRHVNSDDQHIYIDHNGFKYDIVLSRIDLANNTNERYQLRIYESNTTPSTYTAHATFHRPGLAPVPIPLTPLGMTFYDAFARFRSFFFAKTRMEWHDRMNIEVIARGAGQMSGAEKPFVYIGPNGRPWGFVSGNVKGKGEVVGTVEGEGGSSPLRSPFMSPLVNH